MTYKVELQQANIQGCQIVTPHSDAIRAIVGAGQCGGPENLFDPQGLWIDNSGTNWIDNGDGTWSVNVATQNSRLYQDISSLLVNGHTYSIGFQILNASGNWRFIVGSTLGAIRSGSGDFSEDILNTASQANTGIQANTGATLTVRTDTAFCYDLGILQ